MTELHPSISAVGAHLDEEMEMAVHASQNQQKKDRRAEQRGRMISSVTKQNEFRPRNTDRQIEEMMRLAQ